MKNFKNSKTAKVVSGFIGLAAVFAMVGPSLASADTSYVFTKTLKQGVTDQEVMNLQTVLNSSVDTAVAASGVGSKGMETKYFGGLTKSAVIKFQEKYASDILTPNGLTKGTGLVGVSTRAKLNAMGGSMTTGTGTTPVSTTLPVGCTSNTGFSPITGQSCVTGMTAVSGTGVSIMVDSSSPVNQTLLSPQGVATLAVFKISNGGSAAAKVTALKFKRTGISSDSTLNNVYLYSGSARLTDSASVSQGVVNFSDASGLVVVPAMSSVLVSVRADIASGANGQTLGIMLTDATADGVNAGGLPVSGSNSTFATAPTDIATANFSATTSIGATDPQNDFTVWQATLNIGSHDALLSSLRLQQVGSIYNTDIKNFRLMIDGVQVGTAVDSIDANRFVTFTMASPLTLKPTNHVVKVMADIVGGSSRDFKFSLRRVVDVEIWDSQLGVVVTPKVQNANFVAVEPVNTASINAGSLTVTKDTSSPSGNVVLNGSNVTLAKFKFRAQGEELKVENLAFNWTGNGLNVSAPTLRSAAVYADGVQIGSTQNLASTSAGTTFNLGSSLILTAGKDVVVEVRADVYNNGTGAALAAGDTITVNLLAASSNIYKRSSLTYTNNTGVSGNQLTVASGNLTLSKYTAYSNQTVTVPQNAYKIGEFRLTTGSTEGVNLDTITLAIGGSVTVSDLTNVYVTYGSKTSVSKATGAASQTFSINEVLAANGNLSFAVYANVNANPANNTTIIPTLTVSGTSQSSGGAVNSSAVTGQTVTVGTGSITSAVDASTPVSALAVQNSMPKIASFKFSALNDAFTIDEITVKASSTADVAAISELIFKDGATEIARASFDGVYATKTGISIPVSYNGTKILDVYAQLGGIGTGFATSSAWINVTLDGFEYMNSNGVKTRDYTDRVGNAMFALKTKPVITNTALPTTVLAAGTMTIGKVTITSDSQGPVDVNKIIFNVATSSATVASPNLYDDADQTTVLGTASLNAAGTQITVTGVNKEVSGSKTFVLKATIGGTINTGSSVSTSISAPTTAHTVGDTAAIVAATSASFVWSDESVVGHSTATADWFTDYLVKNLPTDSQTLTK